MFSINAKDLNVILKRNLNRKTMFRCKDDIFFVDVVSITPQSGPDAEQELTKQNATEKYDDYLKRISGGIHSCHTLSAFKKDRSVIESKTEHPHKLTFFCNDKRVKRFHYDADFLINFHPKAKNEAEAENADEYYHLKVKIFNYANFALLDKSCCDSNHSSIDQSLSEEQFDEIFKGIHHQLDYLDKESHIKSLSSL